MTAETARLDLADPLSRLVINASSQHRLSGLRGILRTIAQEVHADACGVWEVAPGPALPEQRRLFVLAEHTPAEAASPWPEIPIHSAAGAAILRRRTQSCIVEPDECASRLEGSAMLQRGIRAYCCTPMSLRGGTEQDAVLAAYRTSLTPFGPFETSVLERLAELLPYLYASLVNHVGFELLRELNKILRGAGSGTAGGIREDAEVQERETLSLIVEIISRTFNCLETCIYLEDPLKAPDVYELRAKRWPWAEHQPRPDYRRGHGLTGYALATGKPVRIFDLKRYQEDYEFISSEYPGISWSDPVDIKESARKVLNPGPSGELPPLSIMCAPLISGGKVLGVIRCCVTAGGPHFFDDRQVRFLCLVGELVAEWWRNRIRLREREVENQRWKTLVQGLTQLNRFVHGELNRTDPNERRVFEQALDVLSQINPAADILSVRMLDDSGSELRVAAAKGAAWEERGPNDKVPRRDRRFDGGPEARTIAAEVIRTDLVVEVPEFANQNRFLSIFPDVSSILSAPVSSGKHVFGVLDVRGIGEHRIPEHAAAAAELLGRQLGLYHFLALKIRELTRTQAELRETIESQHRTYADFQHQLKTPILTAHKKAIEALRAGFGLPFGMRGQLTAVRGLCRRAEYVVRNLGFFAALAKDEPIELRKSPLVADQLLRLLDEISLDFEVLTDPDRRIRVQLDRASFEPLREVTPYADIMLLTQAVCNLLDNAVKYSFKDTCVNIRGGLTRRRESFFIAVVNRGLRITQAEAARLTEHGYRGDQARWTTGEGSGIGLWIVDRIMREHGGSLQVYPTDEQGNNVFRLLFPVPDRS